jgi:glycosyltransferase involved in cell wall biosynthesis
MNVLQVGNTDIVGRRFNGHDINLWLNAIGHHAFQCVWDKEGDGEQTWELTSRTPRRDKSHKRLREYELKRGLQSLLYPYSFKLMMDGRFWSADVVHYHLIHTGFFSLFALPLLTKMKPSVWTLHDPWAMTGHCIYPFDCERWKTGCGDCPRLSTPIAVEKDSTALMWKIKRQVYRNINADIVVASKWMLNMVHESPLFASVPRERIHHIPFGIDLGVFRPIDSQSARYKLGIKPDSIVICFRSMVSEYKGLPYVIECLRKLETKQPICLLTFHDKDQLTQLADRFQIIDLGWVNDQDLTVQAYNAADIFLMPSTAEAFGMMAIEAMACGKPVITFDGTSLPEVTFAPDGGITVPQGDVSALHFELQQLIDCPEKRLQLGRNALELARRHYNFNDHAEKILKLYEEVIARRKRKRA